MMMMVSNMPVSILVGFKGDLMKVIQYILIFAGIFIFLSLGVFFIIKGNEIKKKSSKAFENHQKMLQETNQQLDELLESLDEVNEPLEEVAGFLDKVNNKIF